MEEKQSSIVFCEELLQPTLQSAETIRLSENTLLMLFGRTSVRPYQVTPPRCVCVCVLVNLTLSHVKPRRLSEAVYDECEGLHRRVHFPGQFLHTPGLHLVLHTLMKRWTSNLICTLIQERQKPRTDVKEKVTYYYEKLRFQSTNNNNNEVWL